ncbi:hypothetical protein HYQ46_002592 [Verticillium longisporum]|nr:hypothetical protein HYQ46_002592 [Verticillium longisporum]
MEVTVRCRCVLVEDDLLSLVVVHPRQRLHKVAQLLPLVVVALQEVFARQVDARAQREHGRQRLLVLVFVIAERTVVEDAAQFLVFADGDVFEVNFRLVHPFRELVGIFVQVLEVVVKLAILGDPLSQSSTFAAGLPTRPPLLAHHVLDGHVIIGFHIAPLPPALRLHGLDLASAAGKHPVVLGTERDGLRALGRKASRGCVFFRLGYPVGWPRGHQSPC